LVPNDAAMAHTIIGPVARAFTALVAVPLLVGCSLQSAAKSPGLPPGGAAGLCPAAITELVDVGKKPATEWDLSLDKSGSFVNSSGGISRAEAQVQAVVEKAVADGAALRIWVFAGSLATVKTVIVCSTMAVKHNNDAAKSSKADHLRQVASDAVWEAVRTASVAAGGKGTSVVGGWAAVAEADALAEHRHAVMISDGRGTLEEVAVDLSGFETVGMYSIGRVAKKSSDTQKTAALVERWRKWLTSHGAEHGLTVTSGEFQ
jgi:hypothetical protein